MRAAALKAIPLKIGYGLVMIGAALLAYYVCFVPDPFYCKPHAVRTYLRNREAINTYVQNIYRGQIPELRHPGMFGDTDYYLLDVLRPEGVFAVSKQNDCVVIMFEFLPDQAARELIYSPDGRRGLPSKYLAPNPNWVIFEIREIEPNWYYCRWNM